MTAPLLLSFVAHDGDPVEFTNKKQLKKWVTEHRAAILAARRE